MKWIVGTLGALVALVVVVLVIGVSLEERHTVTRTATLPQPPAEVWAVIRDFGSAAEWQPDVESMERMEGESSETWRMGGSFGDMPIRVEDEVAGYELVTRIVDDDMPFGGTWTYQLEPVEEGTRLTITEDGFVRNPFYRFMSRYVFGYEKTVEDYLEALSERLAAAP
jgi:carbon monoxide dehydrogenase subunit G